MKKTTKYMLSLVLLLGGGAMIISRTRNIEIFGGVIAAQVEAMNEDPSKIFDDFASMLSED